MSVLTIQHLSKHYGRIKAVDDLSLTIDAGQVFGLLGPNGSGKTTTLGIILGIIQATQGSFDWFGGMKGKQARLRIGALLETPNFYPYLSAVENLKIIAHIKRVKEPRIDEHLQMVKLLERKHSKFSTYSLGMKQRLAIAASMIGDPEVLIFDEPTNGLDPQGIAEVRGTIQAIAEQGKTILMASHILDEVEKVCSHVGILKRGKLLATGTVGAILSNQQTIEVGAQEMEALEQLLQKLPHIKNMTRDNQHKWILSTEETFDTAQLNRMAFEAGITLTHLAARPRSLESEFLEITRES